jgi:hypothetical protein
MFMSTARQGCRGVQPNAKPVLSQIGSIVELYTFIFSSKLVRVSVIDCRTVLDFVTVNIGIGFA